MASTRNKNCPGDYDLQQRAYRQSFERMSFDHSSFVGHPTQSYMPGQGLVGGKIAPRILAQNFSDVESDLFGIGATNLVEGPRILPVTAESPLQYQYLDVALRPRELIMPAAFAPQENQRPMYLN